jgi:hypothetical protein
VIAINVQSRSRIEKLNLELVEMIKNKEDLNNKKVIIKIQELDKKIVSFMESNLK